MQIIPGQLYHIYNQGNNRNKIFFEGENYLFFLEKFREYVYPHTEVLAYCLMPNHFHFLIYSTERTVAEIKVGQLTMTALGNGFRHLLSSYAQAINKQMNWSGSLFRQHTKAKHLENKSDNYPLICFQYIHQNPISSRLVSKIEDWEFSSYLDYVGLRKGTICNKALAFKLLSICKEDLYEQSNMFLKVKKVKKLF